MIKNRLKTLLIGVTLIGSSLLADTSTYNFDTSSLLGIEGGYSSLNYEYGTRTNNSVKSTGAFEGGLKIGAETENFRLFLSGRYFHASSSKYDYIVTYGGELQRKFHVAKSFNIFMGVNGGIANLAFNANGESYTRTISNPYVGGDAGANIHLGNSIDWEIGARAITIQADNIRDGKTYHVDEMVSIYTSMIFKWHMD